MNRLSDDIRQIYQSTGAGADKAIEAFVSEKLEGLSARERLNALDALKATFRGSDGSPAAIGAGDDDVLSGVFSLLLGRKVSRADLSSSELLKRLAESLNTIFDILNELVGVINATFTSQGVGEETIRQVIGVQVEDQEETKSLEIYLGQIKKAFFIAQEAFKKAADRKMAQVLAELDPEKISEGAGGGLKFGPLRKAEIFDLYADKFRTVKKWFDTGRFSEEFLREFEKYAQKL